jgi:hypothetical protein
MRLRYPLIPLLVAVCGAAPPLPAAPALQPGDQITAVSAKAAPDYARQRKNGRYVDEYYAFGEGGHIGGPMTDESIDSLKFIDVARTVSGPLSEQNYVPSHDPKTTNLLIMVYWGLTEVPHVFGADPWVSNLSDIEGKAASERSTANAQGSGSAGRGYHSKNSNDGVSDSTLAQMSAQETIMNIENQQRAHQDFMNASMLGYDTEEVIGTDYGNNVRGTPMALHRQTLVDEIEDNRYFVVLMAYDFQLLWKEKKHKLLWETRFSLRQRHNQFDRDLEGMARAAEAYFGQNSGGLIHRPVPVGRVDIGPIQVVGAPEDK